MLWGLARLHPETRFQFCYRPHRLLKSFAERLPSNAHRRLLSYARQPRASLFHGLNQRLEFESKTAPTVVTFHDLFVMTGDYSSAEFRHQFAAQARAAADRADLVIGVSRFTADQVRDLLGVPESRIRVVRHGTRPAALPPADDAARENLILHVGAIQKRKNLERLIRAFERVPEDWRLVLTGSNGWKSEDVLAVSAASPARARIEATGYINDAALEHLYARARVFAFPSLDEGFGIPVIEAMSRGVPVLTSDRSALPETAGGAALLVNPLDVESIADGLKRLTDDVALRNDLRVRGFRQAAEMTWAQAVAGTWAVYQELLTE